MRRSGKTCFLHQLRQQQIDAGRPQDALPYLSFEDERLAGVEAAHLATLVEEFYGHKPGLRSGPEPVLWCLDEIQVVPGWQRFVRRLLDTESVQIALSGSSAELLSREIATELRGRAWTVVVHPFSFREALIHAGTGVPEDSEVLGTGARSRMEKALEDYLVEGGFPEAQGQTAAVRSQLLRDYVDVAMLRDVVERHQVKNVTALRWLTRHLLGNAAGSFSVEKFHASLRSMGIAVGKDTLHALVGYLEDCFLVRTVWMDTASIRQQMVNPRKAYPIDPGLMRIFDRTGRANLGHALETVVYLELERRGAQVAYVRTPGGFEVDFLARYPDSRTELVQVCLDASEFGTARRELRALEDARGLYPDARATLVTLTGRGQPKEIPAHVTVMPAHVWLLHEHKGW